MDVSGPPSIAEFRDLSSGKGPGLPGSYPDSIVRIFILFGGENNEKRRRNRSKQNEKVDLQSLLRALYDEALQVS